MATSPPVQAAAWTMLAPSVAPLKTAAVATRLMSVVGMSRGFRPTGITTRSHLPACRTIECPSSLSLCFGSFRRKQSLQRKLKSFNPAVGLASSQREDGRCSAAVEYHSRLGMAGRDLAAHVCPEQDRWRGSPEVQSAEQLCLPTPELPADSTQTAPCIARTHTHNVLTFSPILSSQCPFL